MKNLKLFILATLALVSFNACQQDDDLEFVAAPEGEFSFTNTFLEEYLLTQQTSANIAERFVFSSASFDAPTNINYQLQYSIIGDFSDATDISAPTSGNEISVTVGNLLDIAEDAGLDNDPTTDDKPESGDISFRVRAYPGDGGSTTELFSTTQLITIRLLEQATGGGSDITLSSWGVVGSAYNNWGAFSDGQFYTTAQPGVIVSYVTLVDGEIKFRENNTWGGDLGDANDDGILDADPDNNIAVTAGNYKITIDTNDNSYTIEEFSWGIVGSAYNDWVATTDAKFFYDAITNSIVGYVTLVDGEIKFRVNNTWGGDLGDANGDGILDADPDNDIAVTEGHYTITFNLNDNSYSIVEDSVWGIVGSGYNDWGGGGPDFALTQIQPDVYVGDIVTLIDGEIKFRPNNEWNGDLGDANGDGVLDADPDNNIVVTAGNYRVRIDFTDNSYQLNQVN